MIPSGWVDAQMADDAFDLLYEMGNVLYQLDETPEIAALLERWADLSSAYEDSFEQALHQSGIEL